MEFQTFDKNPYMTKHFKELPCYQLFSSLKYIGIIASMFFLILAGISVYLNKNIQFLPFYLGAAALPLAVLLAIHQYLVRVYMPRIWKLKIPERISFFDGYLEIYGYYGTDGYDVEESTEIAYADIATIDYRKSKEQIDITCYPNTAYTVHKRTLYNKSKRKKRTFVPKYNCFTVYLSFDNTDEFLELLKQKTHKKIKIYR